MAIIYTYPVKASPVDDDLVLISDSADKNNTKQVKISSMRGATVSGVADVNIGTSSASTGAPLVSLPNSGNVIITSKAYAGTSNVGHVPSGGSATTFLRGDGSWIVPTNTTYDIMGSGNSYAAGLVLAGSSTHSNNFLRKDGTWASPTVTPAGQNTQVQFNNAGSLSANDELTYDGNGALTVGAVGGNKGIVILQPEDSNDSGILKIGHLNNTKYLSLGLGNNTMAASYSIDFPVAAPGGNNKILESNSSGVLSWITTPAAGAVTSYTNGTDNRILTSSGADSINGESSLVYDGSTLTLSVNKKIQLTRNDTNIGGPSASLFIDQTTTAAAGTSNIWTAVSTQTAQKCISFAYDTTEVGFIRPASTSAIEIGGYTSDERLKTDIVDWDDKVLDKFKAINPKKYKYTKDKELEIEKEFKGFIAQDMQDKFPEAYKKDLPTEEGGLEYYYFDPIAMITPLMKAIKELNEKIEVLESK